MNSGQGIERELRSNAAPQRGTRRTAVVLFCVMAVIYLANLRNVTTGDTWASRYVPFAILNQQTLAVDPYIERFTRPFLEGKLPWGLYFAAQSHGHWMSSYPILTPILVTPLYLPAAWWVYHKHFDPSSDAMIFVSLAMEKLSAAVIAALSVSILYLAFRRVLAARAALLLALVYALASPTWSLSSQALWLQGLNELALALLIWALVRYDGSRRVAFWIGLACALAIANKLTNALVVFPVMVWFVWRQIRPSGDEAPGSARRLTSFFAPLVALGALVMVYNFYYFGNLFGAYESTFKNLGYVGIEGGFHGSWLQGIAGLLASPNRGLFVFVPWTLFSIWGAAILIRRDPRGWMPWLAAGALLHFLFYAKLERWYGGYTFGPRYLVDLLPLLAFWLAPFFERPRGTAVKALLSLAIAFAIFVQVIGAFFYPNGDWNDKPVSVDIAPQRVWDWRDPQLLRTLRAGPAHTKFLDHLRGHHEQNPGR
jgi:hypothetical protein